MIVIVSARLPYLRRLLRTVFLSLLIWGTVWGTALAGQSPPVRDLTLGMSTQGRAIPMVRIGDGPRKLVLVGATHGWPERNTHEMSLQLIDHFRAHPEEVPSNVSLYIVPLLNPDGMQTRSRLNANSVDLNRNMNTKADTCPENDWRQRVNGAYGIVADSGGPYSESEIESQLIRDFLLDADGAIFYHSNAGVVFPACEHAPSADMAKAYAEGSKYTFIPQWTRYLITGGMHDWAGGMGIPAITPELLTGSAPEFDRNLAGVKAILNNAETLLLGPEPREAYGIEVQPVIWRAWHAWGGEAIFGKPLRPPEETRDGWAQLFENARFEYHPAQSHSRFAVQLSSFGQQFDGGPRTALERTPGNAVDPEQIAIEHDAVFTHYMQRHGGLSIFGDPIADPHAATNARGQAIIHQIFQRAIMERPIDATDLEDVQLLPIGRIMVARDDATSEQSAVRPR